MRIAMVALPKTRRKVALVLALVLLILMAGPVLRVIAVRQASALPGLPLTGKTLFLDPGHGGYDPGVFRNNIEEKMVALGIALALRDYLQSAGAHVVMTRETDRDLLVLPTAGPKKRQDMKNRLKKYADANPDMVISIHANAISASRWRGAQVFYKKDCEQSKALAAKIQLEFARVLENTTRQEKPGNYFILNEVAVPAVLVEAGFISNPAEARLLADPEYQAKIAWAVYLAVLDFFTVSAAHD